jgi:hypothetical protein
MCSQEEGVSINVQYFIHDKHDKFRDHTVHTHTLDTLTPKLSGKRDSHSQPRPIDVVTLPPLERCTALELPR